MKYVFAEGKAVPMPNHDPRSKRELVEHLLEVWHGTTRSIMHPHEMMRWTREELDQTHADYHLIGEHRGFKP